MAHAGKGASSSSSSSSTSQTSTAATDNTAQNVQNNTQVQQATNSLQHSIQALQALQASQAAARSAALASTVNNLGLNPLQPGQTLSNVTDGLGANGLNPVGGANPLAGGGSTIQLIDLGNSGSNGSLNLGKGGSVVLPKGTPGNDTVTISGAGSLTSSGGSVTATAGSLTTSSGGTLSTTAGGSVTVTGSGSTLTTVSGTTLTSTTGGTVTLAGGGGTATLAANTSTFIPAGATISFSGTGTDQVTIAGAGTVTLKGAGTLALAGPPGSGSGGSITSNTGTVSFTSGVTTTLPAGATIDLNGAGSVNFASGTGGTVPVIINSSTANYTTTGTVLDSTGYQVPNSGQYAWSGVSALTQSVNPTTGHYVDTVTQSSQQALLYWSNFDIGRNTTLSFDQSAGGANVGQWVAINQILNPNLAPSQILGHIEAPGQVYVINQNGIIFGGSSQVDVGALTVSSLALNPGYIQNGLLNDAANNFEFQFSSLVASTTTTTTISRTNKVTTTVVAPLWTAPPPNSSNTTVVVASVPTGDITVQAGAQLSSPTNALNQGGRIALIAPNVTNDGTISTPDGQTILAAGLQVGFSAHDSNDASLRGLDVYVGRVSTSTATFPTGTFTFDGMPGGGELTFSGSGQIGTYTPPGGTATPITGGSSPAIPVGSSVTLTGGAPTFAGVTGGTATNAANTLDASGNITNPGGDIEAPRADVTITGSEVDQDGIINGSTSATLNGRIDLLADYDAAAGQTNTSMAFFAFKDGTVNMGSQSVTQILPETSSSETTIGTTLAISSIVNVQGQSINMLSDPTINSAALLYAPGANSPSPSSNNAVDLAGEVLGSGVNFNAGTWFVNGTQFGQETTLFSNSTGTINIGDNATIDVSGSQDVSASVAQDIIAVQLRGPELANSSLQRDGDLRGTTVYVDIRDTGVYNGTPWIGTPIGDVSGYANDVQRTVGELTVNGGTVALKAGGAVTTGSGASINVSGGSIDYSGANVQTTQVLSDGHLIDISQATPNLVYNGVYNGYTQSSSKWGVSQTFLNSLLTGTQYDTGYTQGGNGGKVSISAPSLNLQGNFYGNTVSGLFQRTPQSALNSTDAGASFLPTTLSISGVPLSSTLSLNFLQPTVNGGGVVYSTSPNVEFQTDAYISQNGSTSLANTNTLLLSQDIINNNGFGNVSIDTSAGGVTNGIEGGSIIVPAGVSLTAPVGGNLTFLAANADIGGSISAPGGGAINFTISDASPSSTAGGFSTPAQNTTRGVFTLESTGSLSAPGLVVDDRPTSGTANTQPLATNGGTVSIGALDVVLDNGSTIDVSGGLRLQGSTQTFGNAGSINILGGEDPVIGSLVTGGELQLGATLTGYSGNVGGGGKLTIQSPLVQIGGSGTALLNGDSTPSSSMVQGEDGVASNGTTLWLGSSFFNEGGFGSFNIEGIGQIQTNGSGYVFDNNGNPVINPAVLIASGTDIDPQVESLTVATNGNNVALVPLTAAQTAALLPSQRTPVNLSFNAEGVVSTFTGDLPPIKGGGGFVGGVDGGGLLVRGDLVMQAGAKITTDPQTNASHGVSLLASHGTVAMEGSITAPGGTVTITGGNTSSLSSNFLLFYNSSVSQPFATVDLGPQSSISTKGAFEQTVSNLGYTTGSVLPGGNIVLNGNIEADSGATLDVSGTSAMVDETAAALGQSSLGLNGLTLAPTRIASNGGSITFNASQFLYSDATLLGGAGGSGAVGGTLSISAGFSEPPGITNQPPAPGDVTLIVSQQGLNGGFVLPSGAASGQAAVNGQAIPGSSSEVGATVNNALGGEPVYSYFAANSNLFVSSNPSAAAGNNGNKAGGFASLNLAGTVDFVGPVNIHTSKSISVANSSGTANSGDTGGVIYADNAVNLAAPYVALNSYTSDLLPDQVDNYPAATAGTGSLTVNASVLADVGNLSLQNIGTLNFNGAWSGSAFTPSTTAGDVRGVGTLQVAGLLNLNAAQVYPPTESTFTIEGNDVSITSPVGQTLPYLPLSGGGTLNIFAATIEQDGVLRAPFGIINLGNSSTTSVSLSSGSITSVSGVDPRTHQGITVPYGIIDDNGDWFDPQGNNITLSGPPAKAVNITSQTIDIQTGSSVDISGGGNLFAYNFTAGTGGTVDILGSIGGSSTSFAIVPSYSLNYNYAPYGTYAESTNLVTNNVTDVGYYNSALSVGEQIYLNSSNGLPAGTYTLLPARYALLPGAYLISPNSSGASGASVKQPDGSVIVSGYLTNGFNPAASPIFSSYQLYSQSLVLQKAPYTISLANTYFPASAVSGDVATPRLPVDAGQLLLNATQSMSIQGTLLSQAGQDGLGGQVDISSPEDIYITGPNSDLTQITTTDPNSLILNSSQLTGFGAASLLIGGYSTTTSAGTDVTVTTSKIVVDNSGSTTTLDGTTVDGLAAPDLTLVSKSTINVEDGSIEQFGQFSGNAPTLILTGNGAAVRVTSDSSAGIVRNGVTSGNSASLTIGSGVTLANASGGAAGSITLDSSAAMAIGDGTGTSPVINGTSLAIDSGSINVELGTPATAPTSGLVINDTLLQSLLSTTHSLSFLSYSSIGLYGNGIIGGTTGTGSSQTYELANLAFHADDIYYADTQASTGITINAQNISLDNLPGGTTLPSLSGLDTAGYLKMYAQTISLGSNTMHLDQFGEVDLNASSAILLKGLGAIANGTDSNPIAAGLTIGGNVNITTPLITSANSADQTASSNTTSVIDEAIGATGAMTLQAPAASTTAPGAGTLAASLDLSAASIAQNSGSIVLHSGTVSLQANGATAGAAGTDVTVGGTLDVSGVAPAFYDLTKYTNGGQVSLASTNGNVTIGAGGSVNVSAASGPGTADSGAGNGGTLSVAAGGTFNAGTAGQLNGAGGTVKQAGQTIAQGANGTFYLDVGSLNSTGPGSATLSNLEPSLTSFSSQTIRDRKDTLVTVDKTTNVSNFNLSADQGSIDVTATVNAQNTTLVFDSSNDTTTTQTTGGTISLAAGGSVNVTGTLSVAASQLNDAGQGGTISLQAGTYEGTSPGSSAAAVNISGGTINFGAAGGTLNLIAPQLAGGTYVAGQTYTPVAVNAANGGSPTDVAIAPIGGGVINGATSIVIEGVYVQDLSAQGSNAIIDGTPEANAATNAGNFVALGSTIENRIFGSPNAIVQVEPGEEIDNSAGSLELQSSWDLSSMPYRTSSNVPGILTLRATGNINLDFGASISDGFDTTTNGVSYLDPLLAPGSQSWSYNITAGADIKGANLGDVVSSAGSLQIGVQNSNAPKVVTDTTVQNPATFFQTLRTGTGNITINAGGNVVLLNNLATIYTAGSQVDPTLGGTFTQPVGFNLGAQQSLLATYSSGGGNVVINAQGNIEHLAYNINGTKLPLLADSSSELPTNWLDREGAVSGGQVVTPTTWWVDFSNYFEGIGALGGGNVTLSAGGSVVNVDAAVPTNARNVNGSLNELGGGDLVVRASNNIDGGVYYVEKGQGQLSAGGAILTNSTRVAVTFGQPSTSSDELPTTLFLGNGSFSVNAGGNLLLGPVANPFLLPQSANNVISTLGTSQENAEISYFSTYNANDAVNASSLAGAVTIRDYSDSGAGSLYDWYINVLGASRANPLTGQFGGETSSAEQWLMTTLAYGLSNTVFGPSENALPGSPGNIYEGVTALMPPTLRVTSFSGDIDLIGSLTLAPAPEGTLDLVAAGSINAFGINEQDQVGNTLTPVYGESSINVSDTNPANLPSYSSPFSTGTALANLDVFFTETGVTQGLTLQQRQDLHAEIFDPTLQAEEPLHFNDANPVYIYAQSGDISGLTLFSPKQTQVVAGQDITDVGLYLQNNNASDISLIDAGRDIIAYDASSPLRQTAGTNLLGYNGSNDPIGAGVGAPNSGDLQISGPGTLEVLAGRNLTLGNDAGENPNNTGTDDGTFSGLTSVGQQRNPVLPFGGADIITAAGLGAGVSGATGLSGSSLSFSTFIAQFLNPASSFSSTYLPFIASDLGLSNATDQETWTAFQNLSTEAQDQLALQVFYLVLRDSGRDKNSGSNSADTNYQFGDQAISALFPAASTFQGDINLTSREIKTANGGNLELLAPGGQIIVGIENPGGQAIDQGILTVEGGNISIYAKGDVTVGTSRIFTLDGGNEIIWSTLGNIDAGASSKTVVSAPPTRVIVDPTSGAVETDLAGLATGGGIGTLESKAGSFASDVDLIAPSGTINAGDAGIRSSGNVNIAALKVLNASNISAGGKSSGVPTAPSVNVGAVAAAAAAAGSTQAAANNNTPTHQNVADNSQELPSIITVEVVGYGGDDEDDQDDDRRRGHRPTGA